MTPSTPPPPPIRRRGRCRGVTIMHMLTVMILLGPFMLVASRLFLATMETEHATVTARRTVLGAQRLIDQLRADVWQSADARVAHAGAALELTDAQGRTIVYRYADTGKLVRRRGSRRRTVAPADLPKVRFEPCPAGVTLHADANTLVLARPAAMAWERSK